MTDLLKSGMSVGVVRIADLWETRAPASGSRFAAEPRGWLASLATEVAAN
jgi:hypothetical protein